MRTRKCPGKAALLALKVMAKKATYKDIRRLLVMANPVIIIRCAVQISILSIIVMMNKKWITLTFC